MKKILLFASALAGLFLAGSCQRENLEPAAQGGVTYEISLPTGPQTKGEKGYDTYDLYYEVYKTVDDKELAGLKQPLFEDMVIMTGNTHTLQLDLLNDQNYTILFWANKKDMNYFYLADLRQVGIRDAASNNDDRDAFCGMDQLVQHDGAQSKTVELKRPFAQINIATLVNNVDYDINPVSSLVKVKNIPVGYNVFTGKPVGKEVEVTYPVNRVPEGNLTVNGIDYKKVAMNYALVPTTEDNSATVEVYYEINTANGTVKNSIPNVPVQKNYRTNIIGNLLTSNATYTIELKPGFEEGDLAPHPIYLAAANGGEVTLTEDLDLNGKTLEIKGDMSLNLNGKTVTGVMTVEEGADVTIENGTITNTDKTVSGITTNGNLTLNDVEIVSARHAVRVESGKVVINGGTYRVVPVSSSTLHALNVGDNGTEAEVIIKGGEFIGPKGTTADSGSAVNVRSGSKVTIEGGDFSGGKNKTLASGGTLTVKGGSFDQDPTAFVAEGYKKMEKDGKFYVVSNDVVAVLNSKEDLPVENGKLDTVFEENTTLFGNITVSANETNANSGYGATGVQVKAGAVLDGQGYTLTVNNAWDTWDCIVNAQGGTIKNLTVNGAMRGIFMGGADADVYIDNVIFDNVIYTFNSDGGNKNYGVYLSNCTLNGWTSHSDVHKEVVYTNCSFGEGNGYKFCRPYGPTSFVGCDFCAGFEIEPIGKVTFENCTIDGEPLTAANVSALVTSRIGNVISVNDFTQVDGLWINEGTAIVTSPDKVEAALDNTAINTLYLNAGVYTIEVYTNFTVKESLTIIGTEGTQVKFANQQVRMPQCKNFTIENCEILRMATKNWGHLVFGSGDSADGVYTVSNCTFNGVGTQGIYINEETSGATYNITNCTFKGDFGGEGAVVIQNNENVNFTVNVTGCTFNDIPATSHEVCLLNKYTDHILNTNANVACLNRE